MKSSRRHRLLMVLLAVIGLLAALAVPASAHPEDDGGSDEHLERHQPDEALEAHDAANSNVISNGPNAKVIKNLDLVGRGERIGADFTTDVWAHDGYAYTGTFNNPCGGDPEAGIWIWDVHNKNKPSFVGVIGSPVGSRTNDVRVEAMNSGDILVHSNESCAGGPGGFEIYNVDDPTNPVYLASVRIDELNPISDALFGGLTDVGVHNLWLFTQGDQDYVGVTSEGAFDNFRIYNITDPSSPELVSGWGAEELFDPGVGDETVDVGRVLNAALWLLDGFGASANRFLHDVTISDDGNSAYLANWDAGLVLLDISDPANPTVVSVAIDPVNGSLDGEVNSHSVWPSDDGTIVVEGEEDFSAWESFAPPTNLTLDSSVPGDPTIPATAISTSAGDDFEANQTGNLGTTDGTSVEVTSGPLAGNSYPAVELATAAGSPTFGDTGPISGELVFIGRACTGDPVLNAGAVDAGDIAVVRRGACFFEDKAATAAATGAAAVIIANNVEGSTPWSGLRIWDYTDPTSPVLASTFDTTCSAATAPSEECAANGTYSVHNVQVETRGNKTYAYVSWYWDGMLVLDVTDPYNPVEVARYLDTTGPNDGLANDFWGVFLDDAQSPWIYGSDRNGGLYIFKLKGQGTIGKG